MKLEMVCIQLCQGAVSVGCTDKPYIVDSVPDHMVVVAFQKLAAFIPVVVQKPRLWISNSHCTSRVLHHRMHDKSGKPLIHMNCNYTPLWQLCSDSTQLHSI